MNDESPASTESAASTPDGLYREVTDFAEDSPTWAHTLAEYGTEGSLLLLIALLAWACWRAARQHGLREAGGVRGGTSALLALGALAVAYGLSELTKVLVAEERPCRAVPGAAPSLVPCPGSGDWSFPSNHATLALGAATGVLLLWRAMAWLALPVALLTAVSRVFLGVHYPHDVLAGGVLGAGVVALAVRLLPRPWAPLGSRSPIPVVRAEPRDQTSPDS
ncbi:phosphatase PAP2 family protein [Streptomyces sp. N2-109]|uniref:Phosphatase PAP2 family protein n=1 Tax=Streptomyces gossypii TaxID=2883101 RepID=A0ABT2JQ98_9ACTN|nr:phosphatase PAP2 family protein [Streptomyces gossypii]MCT2590057.1 phosphatase PAP2 family protein [Streptomyces gossypii]